MEKNFKLLYVENDSSSILILKKLVEKHFIFDSANTAEQGLIKIINNKYDIILLDINLGSVLNGVDLLKKKKESELNKFTKTFAVTSRVFGDEGKKLLEEGFDGYFGKPYDIDLLVKSIFFVLDNQPKES